MAKKVVDEENMIVLADKGFHHGRELHRCAENGITTVIAYKAHVDGENGPHSTYYVEHFVYDKEKDHYICPNGSTLTHNDDDDSKNKIQPTLNDMATPLLTLAGSYNSQPTMNDTRLVNYLKEINRKNNSYLVVNLYHKGIKENISMNWVISGTARRKMASRSKQRRTLLLLFVACKERRQ